VNPSDFSLLTILTGVVVPLLVGLLAKLEAPGWVKSTLNAGLTALGAAAALFVAADWDWARFAAQWAQGWVVSIATYYGLWKPAGVAGAIQGATANVGIGPSTPSAAPAPTPEPLTGTVPPPAPAGGAAPDDPAPPPYL